MKGLPDIPEPSTIYVHGTYGNYGFKVYDEKAMLRIEESGHCTRQSALMRGARIAANMGYRLVDTTGGK